MARRILLLTVFVLGALAIVSASPARQQRRPIKSSRQTQTDATDFAVEAKTPYPAAGFRPKIPFDFPTDRQPKAVPEPTTTPVAAVDDVGAVDTPSRSGGSSTTVTPPIVVEEDIDDIDVNIDAPRTPANNYGAPKNDVPTDDIDTVELVAAPSADFQPPTFEAVEDFASASDTVAVINIDPVTVDLPTADASTESKSTSKQLTPPEETYGAPEVKQQLAPADTYGVPTLVIPVDDDVVEMNDLAPNVSEGEVEVLNQLRNLQNGRLVFIPADGSSLRQIYIAEAPAPIRKSARRQNGRLRRL